MSITSSGAICDVCGHYILPGIDKSVHPFRCQGIEKMLHCDDKCLIILKEALNKEYWKLLPDGPLKKAFEDNEKGAKL